ncbi:MAG TPA: hypothetical protein PKM97_02450 [Bacteroidia bacterium]|nr:hypothetical protein [Bacteroidia bacterium]
MENLPAYVGTIFILTTILTVVLFFNAAGRSKTVLYILLSWMTIQGMIGQTAFLKQTDEIPPRLALMVAPTLLLIIILFITKKGRSFVDRLNLKTLTILHSVRVPVELVLLWLSIYRYVPQIMTFKGMNLDILSGISAPLIYYLVFMRSHIKKSILLFWNLICLGLLFNIIIIAVLSAPFPFQQFGLDLPNIAVLYFPFNWLPTVVVPIVLLSHLASIRQLLKARLIN